MNAAAAAATTDARLITNKSYHNECTVLHRQFVVGEHHNIKLMLLIKMYKDKFAVKGRR